MHYAVYLPNFGPFGDPRALVELAREAEAAGWDGFFIWDHIAGEAWMGEVIDPWVALAAIALNTTRIRIGALVTPLPRRRPWKVARETVSIGHLSGGRLRHPDRPAGSAAERVGGARGVCERRNPRPLPAGRAGQLAAGRRRIACPPRTAPQTRSLRKAWGVFFVFRSFERPAASCASEAWSLNQVKRRLGNHNARLSYLFAKDKCGSL
jgi:hypothetical protein